MLVGKEKSYKERPQKLLFKHVLRKLFLEDWATKLVALAITLGLWYGVNYLSKGPEISETFSSVPLNLRVLDNAAVTHAEVHDVDVIIKGENDKIQMIRRNELMVYVDLTDLTPGEHVVTLKPDSVSLVPAPSGVRLVDLQPSVIAVTIEAVEEREVPVRVETDGKPPRGFEVYDSTVVPIKVKIRGPASVVNSVDELMTDKISLDDRTENFTAQQVAVKASNPKVTIFNTVVDVVFNIGEVRIEKTFMVPLPGAFTGKKAAVVLYGPKSVLAKLKPENLRIELTKDDGAGPTPSVVLPDSLQGIVEVKKVRTN